MSFAGMSCKAGPKTTTLWRWGRRGRVVVVVAVCSMATLLLLGAAAPATPDVQLLPKQVMAELRSANAARAELLREEQAWAMEAERLELLLATINGETERLDADANEAAAAEEAFRKQLAQMQSHRERFEHVEATVDTLCERLEKALDDLALRSLPGLVPPDRAVGITEPARRLAAAAGRLNDAVSRGREAGIEIVQGDLAGKVITIRLLRLGGVASWWMALDGGQAGTAKMVGKKLSLTRADEPHGIEAIGRAFAIVEGRAAPNWVLLPMGGDVVDSAKESQP